MYSKRSQNKQKQSKEDETNWIQLDQCHAIISYWGTQQQYANYLGLEIKRISKNGGKSKEIKQSKFIYC